MSKKRHQDKLMKFAEAYAISLLYEASGGSIGKPLSKGGDLAVNKPYSEKLKTLDSITKLMSCRSKVDPGDDDKSGVEFYREQLHGIGDAASNGGTSDGDD